MGTIFQIVLNNFSIVGEKISSHLFQTIEFMLKQRDDFLQFN
jgi:hypothetical protein